VGEEREHPYSRILRGLLPYLAGANFIGLIFIVFRYNNRRMIILMILCGLFVNEVARTINRKYQEAIAKRLADDSRREKHVCAPKGYFSAAFDSLAGVFVKTEDDCYKFYREAMVDVDLDVKILATAFSVLGETFGSFFVGLSSAIREAVENYFAPAPFYVQIIKMMVLIILLLVGLVFALKFCQFEIQIPFIKFRWRMF
uniref:Uncharacterized protein n=1 Tax=Panagrolaimus sp. JU765 TaxID=591449 RepID=A0AC34RCS0_9BILA